jgi:hypothetical protein
MTNRPTNPIPPWLIVAGVVTVLAAATGVFGLPMRAAKKGWRI